MWIYSTTTATSACVTSLSRTQSQSEHRTESYSATGIAGPATSTLVSDYFSASTHVAQPVETRQTTRFADTVGCTLGATGPGTAFLAINETRGTTRNISAEYLTNFSKFVTNYTSAETRTQSQNDNGVTSSISLTTLTTSSSQSTWIATRPSYLSGTITTTSAMAAGTTSTATATTSQVTTTAGTTTASTSAATTSVVTTTAASTITTTVGATAAARTLTAAEALVAVTEAAADEDLWEITQTADSAGFISEVAATFTRRTGTLATSSSVLSVASSMGSYGVTFSATQTSAAATVDTTATSSSADTHVPFAGVYPATLTSTRSFGLLTMITSTIGQSQISSTMANFATSVTGPSASTIRRTTTAGLNIRYNQAATATATAILGVTVATSSTIAGRPIPPQLASSASATVSAATFASGTTTASKTVTSTTSTTSTGTASLFTYGTTFTVFISSASAVSTCAVAASTQTASAQTNHAGYTDAEYYSTFHNAPSDHTLSTSAVQWQAYTLLSTRTTTSTGSTSTNTTGTGTISIDSSYVTGSSSIGIEGVSYTYGLLSPQVTFDGTARASFIAWRQGGGHQHPLSLAVGDALHTAQPIAGYFAWGSLTASQINPSGAITPALDTMATMHTTGATIATARWDTSDSRMHLTTGITTTYTATSRTGTSTTTSATGTTTASFSSQSGATYYSAETATAASLWSRMGGQAGNSAFAFTALLPPGVRHSTTQSSGSSASGTAWGTDWLIVSGTSAGLALPVTDESAWSVTQCRTSWLLLDNSEFIASTGSTSRPVASLSKFPSL